MRVAVDVGAHTGQSLEELVEPRWGFDRIIAFEPMVREYAFLVHEFGDRVEVRNFGLSDRTDRILVYGSNDICEASVYADKIDLDNRIATECAFIEASAVFALIPFTDQVFVKMNCEGSEVPILNNLIDTGEIWKIHALRVDLDFRRCPSQIADGEALLARLDKIGFDRFVAHDPINDPEPGPERAVVAAWLEANGL